MDLVKNIKSFELHDFMPTIKHNAIKLNHKIWTYLGLGSSMEFQQKPLPTIQKQCNIYLRTYFVDREHATLKPYTTKIICYTSKLMQ